MDNGAGQHTRAPPHRRSRVKSGCRTCKIRKVKCDEGRPACSRCVTTGRVCDGYGIWGGGGNTYADQASAAARDDKRQCPTMAIVRASNRSPTEQVTSEELGYLEWFTRMTTTKLPGAFASSFWNTLLLQASSTEPAVLHAVLALSSAHQADVARESSPRSITNSSTNSIGHPTSPLPRISPPSCPGPRERFLLQHYTKAIGQLQPYFSSPRNRGSIRVALVTCAVFVSLEFLRGHLQTGVKHLENGLNMLRGMLPSCRPPRNDDTEADRAPNHHRRLDVPPREAVDDWINELFGQMRQQVELFGYKFLRPHEEGVRWDSNLPTIPTEFTYMGHARAHQDYLINGILALSPQNRRRRQGIETFSIPHQTLVAWQSSLKRGLDDWLRSFDVSCPKILEIRNNTSIVAAARESFASRLLRAHYTMATIMAATCVSSSSSPSNTAAATTASNESVYDDYLRDFASIVRQSIDMYHVGTRTVLFEMMLPASRETSASIADRGWMPPLYYTALKCRVRPLRVQAARLLGSMPHREGIWDSTLAAAVAREVISIEEGGCGGLRESDCGGVPEEEEQEDDDDEVAAMLIPPNVAALETYPRLPESQRMQEVDVELVDGPLEKVSLTCRRRLDNGAWLVVTKEYNPPRRVWSLR